MEAVPVCAPFTLQVDEATVVDVALAHLGGPLAVLTDDDKVHIFTGAGKRLAERSMAPARACKGGFGWTGELSLVCVNRDDGSVAVLDVPCATPRRIAGFEAPIHLAAVWEGGVVAVTAALRVLHLTVDWTCATAELCARLPLVSLPRCLCVARPLAANKAEVHVALTEQAGCLRVGADGGVSGQVPEFACAPSVVLAAHPFKDWLVSFGTDETVVVVTADWSQLLFCRDVRHEMAPDCAVRLPRVDWSGDAVALTWPRAPWSVHRRRQAQCAGVLVLSGSNGKDEARFALSTELAAAASEVDGLRVMGASQAVLVRQRPAVLAALGRAGSTTPGALVVEALAALDAKDAQGFALLQSVDRMRDACEELLSAALHESDVHARVRWLRAAALTGAGGDRLGALARDARAVAAMAWERKAAATTLCQLEAASRQSCLARLAKTGGDFALAASVARLWALSERPVAAAWLRWHAAEGDEAAMARALSRHRGAAAATALAAHAAGRRDVALRALGMELRLDRRAQALVAMGESARAAELVDASSGADPNLRRTRAEPAPMDAAMALVAAAAATRDVEHAVACLEGAAKRFGALGRKDLVTYASAHAGLLQMQQSVGPSLVGQSQCNSVVECVARRQDDLAAKFAQGLSPELDWHCRLRGLARRGAFADAHKLATSRESARYVSLLDVAEACIEAGEAGKLYAAQVAFDMPMDDGRAYVFAALEMFKEAIDAASTEDSLQLVVYQCPDARLVEAAKTKIALFRGGGGVGGGGGGMVQASMRAVVAARRCDTQ